MKASRQALETGNINYILIWVRQKDEAEVRGIFEKVTKVRTLSREAKDLADMYFYTFIFAFTKLLKIFVFTFIIVITLYSRECESYRV